MTYALDARVRELAAHVGRDYAAAVAAAEPHADYITALDAATSAPTTQNRISALIGGQLVEWVRQSGGPCLGGGWVPAEIASPHHFGAAGDGVSDDAAAWEGAMDWMEQIGGGEIHLFKGQTYSCGPITFASNTTLRMNGAVLAVDPSTPKTGDWLTNRNVSEDGTRACRNPQIVGPGIIDGYAREFDRWLSRLDGTPITDPEADYVAGTGALASGITGVSLTATVADGAVSGVTINAGGSGWNGHPTHPYVPDTVALRFVGGGGMGAAGYATITGGTLASVTVTDGGRDYTTPPTVETMGGYADIELLTTPDVNRRNPDYSSTGSGIVWNKVERPVVENVTIRGFRCRVLSDAGCLGAVFRNIEYIDCGKNDGPFHCFWVQSFGNPTQGQSFYAPSEAPLIENIVAVKGNERSLALFAPTKGGTMRNVRARGCGESTIYIPETLNHDGGVALIEGFDLSDGYITDIVSCLIEAAGTKNLTIRNGRLARSSGTAIASAGCTDFLCDNVTFENNGTGATTGEDFVLPYAPFSERFGFNSGTRPIGGTYLPMSQVVPVSIGSLQSKGGNNTTYRGNTFKENRAVFPPALFAQTKSGSNSIAGTTEIIDNDVTGIPSGMALLDRTIGTVWESNMPLSIRGNKGHASETPAVVAQQINATGNYTITCGFRPRYVEVFAAMNNNTLFRTFMGAFSWQRSGVRNDFGLQQTTSYSGAAQLSRICDEDVVRLVDEAGTTTVLVEFVSWTENGFIVTCPTYGAGGLANVRFVCHP